MVKVASMAALLAGAAFLAPAGAFAISSEPASGDAESGAQVGDPDDQLDNIANPFPAADGSATIELPPIDIPEGDSGDYSPPESDDDGANDETSPSDDTQN